MVYPITKILILPIFRLFVKDVIGLSNIPKKGPFVIAANHSSFLDPLILPAVIIPKVNQKICFLTNPAGIWNLFPAFISVKWAGCIPIRKTKTIKRKPLPIAIEFLKKGKIIGIFPEGTRNQKNLMKAHTGVARLALEGVPIIPIGIKGTFDLWPRKKVLPKFKRNAQIIISKPMTFKKLDEKKINKEILNKITKKIMKRIGLLINQNYPY